MLCKLLRYLHDLDTKPSDRISQLVKLVVVALIVK